MKQIMNKSLILVFMMACVLCTSCTQLLEQELTATGVDNFHSISNEYEIDCFLMPTEDFITRFISEESDYYYYNKTLKTEKSFIYFRYDEEEYKRAYEFVQGNMSFLNEYTYEIGDYTFLLQDMHARTPGASVSQYPEWFWMMFYSQEAKTIGFFGYYCHLSNQIVKPYEDFRGFLETEFPCFEW